MVRGELIGDDAASAGLTLVSGVSLRELPIGPAEAFLMSRIDGVSSPADLAIATGMVLEEVEAILARLVDLGAVHDGRAGAGASQSITARSGAHPITIPAPAGSVGSPAPAAELTAEQQHALLDLDQNAGSLDHYQLLGVEPTADPKAIRGAYYELVRVYHPDRYFGRRLGSFEAPLLRVFGRFTEAYEVLRRAETRADYDRYLAARQRTMAFEQGFYGKAPSSTPPASGARESIVPSSGPVRRPSASQALDPEARRRALARKLGHSSAPPARPSSSSVPAPSSSSVAAEELKRRYEQRAQQAKEAQRDHYLSLANEASSRNDLLAAANALRIACSLDPENLELAGDLNELQRRAAEGLWESYLERAKYAAIEGHFAEAAECYERAALGQPSASLCERAAFFTLEAGGDLRRASQLAKQAVSLAPNSAKCRLTLAQVYAAAKLRESALAELERARALEPDQPVIKEWIARVKRGD